MLKKESGASLFWMLSGAALLLTLLLVFDMFGVLPSISGIENEASGEYGLRYNDTAHSFPGYTLVSVPHVDTVYLIDWKGRLAHEWRVPGTPSKEERDANPLLGIAGTLQSKLLPNGNLLTGHGGVESLERPDGSMTELLELDPAGKTVWNYKNSMMHHDFDRLPDGNTAIIVWEKRSKEESARIKSGIPGSEYAKDGIVFSDAIIEVDQDRNEVWRWSAFSHLDPGAPENRFDAISSREVWPWINNVKYVAKNPITGTPAYLIGMNKIDQMAFVERGTGKILWRAGRGIFAGTHSGELTSAGNVLVFDNGVSRSDLSSRGVQASFRYQYPFSRVTEIDPKNGNRVTFTFTTGPRAIGRHLFYTPTHGSVQELPNGNILVSSGEQGRIFEITRDTGTVVWDYENPFGSPVPNWPGVIVNPLYSAFRYTDAYVAPLLAGF